MPIIHRRPFWDLWPAGWEEEDDHFLERPKRSNLFEIQPFFKSPKIDIYEDKGKVVAQVELPGASPENIKVEVENNTLRVEVKTEEKKEEKGKGKGYYRKEISSGFASRAVSLPVAVKGEKAEAVYENGILSVTVPKVEPQKEEKKKGIKIKVKEKKSS